MWLDKSINVTEISSEDYEYLVNRFGTLTAKDVFSKSDLEDLELEENYPVVVIKCYKEDYEYDLIFAFKVGSRYYFYTDTFLKR